MTRSKILYNGFLFCVFGLLSFIGMLHHEIWIDEAHHWLIARDSHSLKELIYHLRYDGHPPLWNVLLYFVSKATHDPMGMQVLHLTFSMGATFLFLFYSHFPKTIKGLYIFSYYVLFEYNLLSRNYSLLLFFLFLSVLLLHHGKHPILLAASIALLANTHLFGLLLALGLLGYILYFEWNKIFINKHLFVFLILATGLGTSLYCLSSAVHSPFIHHIPYFKKAGVVLSSFLKGFFPVPDFSLPHFWNTNLFFTHFKVASYGLSMALFFLPFLFLFKKPGTLCLFYGCTFAILFSIFLSTISSTRHFGILFFLFLISLWLSEKEPENAWYTRFGISSSFATFLSRVHCPILFAIFSIQSISGVFTYLQDLKRPFAEGKNVAQYLKKQGLDNAFLMSFVAPTPTITSYLESKTFLVKAGNWASHFDWEENYQAETEEEVELAKAIKYANGQDREAVLILYLPMSTRSDISRQFVLLQAFTNSIVNNETFYVYQFKKQE